MSKTWYPVVVYPEGCVQGCHGCGNLCPTEAIQYVGDIKKENENCCCSCGDDSGGDCNE